MTTTGTQLYNDLVTTAAANLLTAPLVTVKKSLTFSNASLSTLTIHGNLTLNDGVDPERPYRRSYDERSDRPVRSRPDRSNCRR